MYAVSFFRTKEWESYCYTLEVETHIPPKCPWTSTAYFVISFVIIIISSSII
jgi:hypothetical protein